MTQHENTTTLQRSRQGDSAASAELLELVYERLRGLASSYLRKERRHHTLQPTELVHEAYLNIVDHRTVTWQDRAHFVAVAARAMRRILVEHARRRGALKRGGDRQRVPLQDTLALSGRATVDVLGLDEALGGLEQLDGRMARVVELRFFGGLNNEETAASLGVSVRTVENDWFAARAWLHRELKKGETSS